MIAESTINVKSIVVVGRSQNGVTQTMIDPDFADAADRYTGRRLYIRNHPVGDCQNEQQRIGWQDERDYAKGRAAYLRALEDEGCPPEWADKYVPGPAVDVNW